MKRGEYLKTNGMDTCMGTLKPRCPTCGTDDFWKGGERAVVKAKARTLSIYECECQTCGETHQIREYHVPVYYSEGD